MQKSQTHKTRKGKEINNMSLVYMIKYYKQVAYAGLFLVHKMMCGRVDKGVYHDS